MNMYYLEAIILALSRSLKQRGLKMIQRLAPFTNNNFYRNNLSSAQPVEKKADKQEQFLKHYEAKPDSARYDHSYFHQGAHIVNFENNPSFSTIQATKPDPGQRLINRWKVTVSDQTFDDKRILIYYNVGDKNDTRQFVLEGTPHVNFVEDGSTITLKDGDKSWTLKEIKPLRNYSGRLRRPSFGPDDQK